MEHLMVEAISRSDRYELIVHGLQVPDTGRTIGELDFLILDKQFDEVIHMEMVYKYYIHDQDEGEGPYGPWIGPGRKDRLTWKLAHLTDHQFPLLHHPMTLPLLAQYGIEPSKVRQELCFLAELYRPIGKRSAVGQGLNNEAMEGEWMPLERFIALDTQGVKAHCPKKVDWLMDYDESLALPLAEIKDEVIQTVKQGRALLLFLCEDGVEKKQFITAT
jgi:hypothetical protein